MSEFTTLRRSVLTTGAICLAAGGVTACGGSSSDEAAGGAGAGKKVYMLLPKTTGIRGTILVLAATVGAILTRGSVCARGGK